jgi:hypothetical protein
MWMFIIQHGNIMCLKSEMKKTKKMDALLPLENPRNYSTQYHFDHPYPKK